MGGATATYSLTSAGLEMASGFANNTWMTVGVASDDDVFATLNSGALSAGTTGSWMNLGVTRAWSVTRGGVVGINTANLTIQIRSAATLAVLASANVIITAETI